MQRQNNTNLWCKCTAISGLLFCALAFSTGSVFAQALPSKDAERIEQMRDQTASITTEATQQADAASNEQPDEPLPPNESLPLGAGEGDLFASQMGQTDDAGSLGDGWLLSTLAALGVVLALVFGIRWLLRRGGVVSTSMPQGSIVEVLSRTTVAPRSHVVLMRVGQRILVVSDSPAGMRTLASVSEAEEVAELLGAVDAAKPTSMSQSFGSVMKKLSGQWSNEDDDLAGDSELATADESASRMEPSLGALSRVRGRLAALSDAGGRA